MIDLLLCHELNEAEAILYGGTTVRNPVAGGVAKAVTQAGKEGNPSSSAATAAYLEGLLRMPPSTILP